MKDATERKGLVVEEHEDRIVLSTSDGETTVMRKDITRIEYQDLEYDLMSLGREMEARKQLNEALSFYERALEANPQLLEAQQAVAGVRSRLRVMEVTGPVDEVNRRQDIEDAWRENVDIDRIARNRKVETEKKLSELQGVGLKQDGEWTVLETVRPGGPMGKRGFRPGDRLVSLDGKSLRYLNEEAVAERMLEPRFSTAVLQIERAIRVPKASGKARLGDMGFGVKQEYNGLTVSKVRPESAGQKAGLAQGDIVARIGESLTRYMPLKKAVKLIEEPSVNELALNINRSITITRN